MKKVILAVLCTASAWANAERFHCLWQPTARPGTYLQYNTKTKRAFTVAGYNDPNCLRTGGRYSDSSGNIERRTKGRVITGISHQCRRDYTGVLVYTNLPPYYKKGFTLVAFGDVPMAHLRLTNNGTTWFERGKAYPYESYYAERFPGNADAPGAWWPTRGVCWTDKFRPVEYEGNNR